MSEDLLKKRAQPIQEVKLADPTINLVDNNANNSNSTGVVSSALMQVGTALFQAEQTKKDKERKRINEISEENLKVSTKIFKYKTKDKIADTMSALENEQPQYYNDQSTYNAKVEQTTSEMTMAINDSTLPEESKAELVFNLNNSVRDVNDKFFKDSTEYGKKRNESSLETLQWSQQNNIMRRVSMNNFSGMPEYFSDFIETAELRHENNPNGYTQKQMNIDITKLSSDIMESHVFGTVETMKSEHDLDTLKGITGYKADIIAYDKSLRDIGFSEEADRVLGQYAVNGKEIKKELAVEINKILVKEKQMIANKEKSVESFMKINRVKIKNETAEFMTKVNGGLPVTKETLQENGGMIYANAKLEADVTNNADGLAMLEVRNERSSMYTSKEMKHMQQVYKDQGYNEDIVSSMDFVEKEYAIKSNGEVGDYWDGQFWLDMEEASGGAINKTIYENYTKGDKNTTEIIRVNQKFSGTDTSFIDMQSITGVGGWWWGTTEHSDAFGIRTANYNRALEDVESYGGEISRRASNMIDNVALGNFVESMTPSKLDAFERMSVEEQEEQIEKYYNDPDKKAKLYQQSEEIQKMYLGDNVMKILQDGTPVLVPSKYEDVDLDLEVEKAKNYDLILPNGATLNSSYHNAVSVGGVKSEGVQIGVTEDIDEGFVLRYGSKPLRIDIDGKKVPATLENLNILNQRRELKTDEEIVEIGEQTMDKIQRIRNGEEIGVSEDLDFLSRFGGSYIRGEGQETVIPNVGASRGVEEKDLDDLANGKLGSTKIKEGVEIEEFEDFAKGRNIVASISEDRIYKSIALNEGTYKKDKIATTLSYAGGKSGLSFGYQQFDTKTNSNSLKVLKDLGVTEKEISDIKKFNKTASYSNFKKFKKTETYKNVKEKLAKGEQKLLKLAKDEVTHSLKFFNKMGFNEKNTELDVLASMVDLKNQFGFSSKGQFAKYFKKIVKEGRKITMDDVLKLRKRTRQGKKYPKDQARRHRNIVDVFKK